MEGLLVCALVLALGLVNADSPCVCNYGSYHGRSRTSRGMQAQVDAQTARISKLASAIHELQSRLESGREKREELASRQTDVSNRLSKMEPNKCGKRQFQCGKGDNNCVPMTSVCDDHRDCPSGGDEDKKICSLPFKSGDVFKGNVHRDESLCTTRRINSFTILISSVRRFTWFRSRTLINADVTVDHSSENEEKHSIFRAHGYYNFATSSLIFEPPEDDRLGIICNFDGEHGDHANCRVVREGTLERCLDFYVEKQ